MSNKSHTHFQTTSSAEWLISHNLNRKVICDVYVDENSTLVKIIPSTVEYVSENQIKVIFTNPRTGRVKVV